MLLSLGQASHRTTSSNSFIGDSSIYEDKFAKVGTGTDSLTFDQLVESVRLPSIRLLLSHFFRFSPPLLELLDHPRMCR